ncbi:MAG: ankryin, partial [Synechococcus sp. SB0668_bin_13]|nr:ankryin [Synechococcus sp. SB0668_bin_13]
PEEMVKLLLAAGADPNARDSDQETPLHGAIGWSDRPEEVMKLLLAAGADPNARNEAGQTPLYTAVERLDEFVEGEGELVKALLAAGADVMARDEYGQTPLHMAVVCPIFLYPCSSQQRLAVTTAMVRVVKVLLAAGADPKAKNKEGKIPVELIFDGSPLHGTDVYWQLNDARF